MWVYPHSLSYFNELVGGPSGGPAHLINSNVDWGQDLLLLRRWQESHPEAKPLNLFYFGYFNPIYAGIEYTVPDELLDPQRRTSISLAEIPPGLYAVSVNFIRGFPFFGYKSDGTKTSLPQGALKSFQQMQPVAKIGYSIYLYHVAASSRLPPRERLH